jgi:hypothetical protein
MDQQTNNRTTGMMVGILFLLCSLPVGWFTIAHPQSGGGSMPASMMPSGPVTATGLSGSIGLFGMQAPIWLGTTLGILSLLFTTLNQREITSLPKLAFVAPWIVSAIQVLLGFYFCVFADDVTLHLGPVLAAVGLGLGFGAGFAELRKMPNQTPQTTRAFGPRV